MKENWFSEMKFSKHQIATAIAILFHCSGLIGIIFSNHRDWFISNTALNLVLMLVLLLWNQPEKNSSLLGFIIICFFVGMGVEMIGVHTGKLFGEYHYGKNMGIDFNGVPLMIGLNWFVLMFCAGIIMTKIHVWIKERYEDSGFSMSPMLERLSLIFDGASMALIFDWIMEPVAMKLGFWEWKESVIPIYNYFCWFIVSMILLWIFSKLKFNKENLFAVDLFIIQVLFFLTLRVML
jgi:bisanhydrobacterioruberin hydratase